MYMINIFKKHDPFKCVWFCDDVYLHNLSDIPIHPIYEKADTVIYLDHTVTGDDTFPNVKTVYTHKQWHSNVLKTFPNVENIKDIHYEDMILLRDVFNNGIVIPKGTTSVIHCNRKPANWEDPSSITELVELISADFLNKFPNLKWCYVDTYEDIAHDNIEELYVLFDFVPRKEINIRCPKLKKLYFYYNCPLKPECVLNVYSKNDVSIVKNDSDYLTCKKLHITE